MFIEKLAYFKANNMLKLSNAHETYKSDIM